MQIEMKRLSELTPYEKNAKKHDEKQIANVANSIKRFGWQQPIVIDENGVIVIGHCRALAAKKLKLKEVPVTVASGLTEDEIKELRIADNKTNESPWDLGLLAEDIEGLDFEGFDLDFGIDGEVGGVTSDEVVEDDFDITSPEQPKAKMGDIYQLGNHRLMCGDSTSEADVDTLLDGRYMRLTVTSPPYGVGKDYEEKGIEPWKSTISGVINAIKGKTLLIGWNIGDLFSTGTQFSEPTGAYSIAMMADAGYGMLYNRIWKKPGGNFAGNNPYYTVTTKPVQDYEYLYCFAATDADRLLDSVKSYLFEQSKIANITDAIVQKIGGPTHMCGHWFTSHQWSFINRENYERISNYCRDEGIDAFRRTYDELHQEYLRNTIFSHNLSKEDFSEWGVYGVWEFNTVHERLGGHAAAFPVELPSRYIKMHSYEGDCVLDPFGGTGTTLMACEQLDRHCYMMERDPHYVDVIISRWENYTGKKAQLISE